MLLNEIGSSVRKYEEEVLFNTEAHEHWYEVEFKDNRVIIYEVNKYYAYELEEGEIECSRTFEEIDTFKCSIEDFTNFVINFYREKAQYESYSYPQEAYVYELINIRNV